MNISLDMEEVHMQMAKMMWKKRKYSTQYRMQSLCRKAITVCVCFILLYAFWYIYRDEMNRAYKYIVVAGLLIIELKVVPKLAEKKYYQENRKEIIEFINKTGKKVISYCLNENCIIKYGLQERQIQWNDIKGYTYEDGWIGLCEDSSEAIKFIMINENNLNEAEKETLNYLLNNNMIEKEIDWKKVWNKIYRKNL